MIGAMIKSVRDSLERPGLGRAVYNVYYLLRESLVPSLRRARRLDHEFDSKFGVATKAYIDLSDLKIPNDAARYGNHYQAVRPTEFEEIIGHIRIRHEEFLFIDFGSGMGRALLLASESPFKKIIGIEFSQELHQIALDNIRKYRSGSQKCRDIEAICMEATQYRIPREKAVFFFYNPFKEEVMAKVLENIRMSLEESPREAFVLYYNPVCGDLFKKSFFEEVKVTRLYAVFRTRGVSI